MTRTVRLLVPLGPRPLGALIAVETSVADWLEAEALAAAYDGGGDGQPRVRPWRDGSWDTVHMGTMGNSR